MTPMHATHRAMELLAVEALSIATDTMPRRLARACETAALYRQTRGTQRIEDETDFRAWAQGRVG